MILAIDLLLLALVVAIAVSVIFIRDLLVTILLLSVYSLIMACMWTLLDAVDVAFTEAAVGAGISTILMLLAMVLCGRHEKRHRHSPAIPLIVCAVTGGAMFYATLDMPPFGRADNPAHLHVAPRYIEQNYRETGVPNMVTGVLAAYRGYDTMGETTVIFTAGIGVAMLLRGARRRRREDAA